MNVDFKLLDVLALNELSFSSVKIKSVKANKSMKVENGSVLHVEESNIEVGLSVTVTHTRGFEVMFDMLVKDSGSAVPVVGGYKAIKLSDADYKVTCTGDNVIHFNKDRLSDCYVLLSLGSSEVDLDEVSNKYAFKLKDDSLEKDFARLVGQRFNSTPKPAESDLVVPKHMFSSLGKLIATALSEITLDNPADRSNDATNNAETHKLSSIVESKAVNITEEVKAKNTNSPSGKDAIISMGTVFGNNQVKPASGGYP